MAEHHYRKKLPRVRQSRTYSFRVDNAEGYVHASTYEDGTLGEIFLTVAKQGSTLGGLVDALAIALSMGLQYGVPLEAYVDKLKSMQFEPNGQTDDDEIPTALSLVDYIFRRLGKDFLDDKTKRKLGL